MWHLPMSLDLSSIKLATKILKGKHDFSSFEGSPTDNKNPICDIRTLDVHENLPTIHVIFTGDRFLKQMVRAIVGTLVEIGQGKRFPQDMKKILEAQDRRAAGKTAPPHGLYLMNVEYNEDS